MKKKYLLLVALLFTIPFFSQEITIGTGTSVQVYPLGNNYGFERSASLYKASELVNTGNISTLAWYANVGGKGARSIKIYLKETTANTIVSSDWSSMTSGATLVYDGSVTPQQEWNTFILNTAFNYTGNANNLLVLVEANYGGSGNGGGASGNSIRYSDVAGTHMYIRGDYSAPTTTGTITAYRPNLKLKFGPLITCFSPIVINATSIATTSSVISWTAPVPVPANGYKYELRTSGAAGSGTAGLVLTGTTVAGVTTANISQLIPNTTYYVYVKAICSATDESNWSSSTSFTTLCLATNVPYTMPINAVTIPAIPACVVVQNVNNDTGIWKTYAAPTGFSGKAMGYYYSSNAADDWFYTQGLNLTAGVSYRLKFKYRNSGYVEKLRVSYGTSQVSTTMTNELFIVTTETVSSTVEKIIDFIPATTGIFYIGFQAYSDAYMNYLYVGDISVELSPTCLEIFSLNTSNITQTDAIISWTAPVTAPSNGYAYEIRTSGAAGSGATGLVTAGTTAAGINTVTITQLTPDTTYSVYVRGICSSTDTGAWSNGVPFTTLCAATNVPYTMPINAVTTPALPACVIVQNVNNDTGTWKSYATPTGFSGKAMGYYYSSNSANDWFYTRGLNLTAGVSYRLKFKYRNSGYVEKLRVSYGLLSVNTAMVNELFTVITPNQTSTVEKILDFIPTATGVYYIGFQAYSDAYMNYLYVGDISVELSPTCLEVFSLNISNITQTDAVISWTAPLITPSNGYAYEIRTSGAAGSGATGLVTAGTTAAGVTTVNTSQLTPNTTYSFYVKSVCSTTETSSWSTALMFTTLCVATNVPYTMPINAVTTPAIPECVIVENVNNDDKTWISYASQTGFTGKVMGYSYHSSNAANDWFYTRGLNLTAGTSYRLKFKYRNDYSAEKLRVSYGNAAVNSAMTNDLFTVSTTTTAATVEKSIDFVPSVTGVYYIGFQAYSDANKYRIYVGDISVELSPTCFELSGVQINSITETTATINWTAPATAPSNGYSYEIRTSGAAGSGNVGLVNSGTTAEGITTVTITQLTPDTTYSVYIRGICSSTDMGAWSNGVSFTTLCTATNVPYTMPINAVTTPTLPACVVVENVNNDDKTWISYASQTGFSGKVMGYPYHSTNVANDWFYTRGLNMTAGVSYRLRFKYRNSWSVEKLRVSYGQSPVNTAMVNEFFTVTTPNAAATVEKVIDFVPTVSGVYYIGFQSYSDQNKSYLYVGDISVELSPTCLMALGVTVGNITKNSAVVNWQTPVIAPQSGYEYELRTSGNPGEAVGLVQSGTLAVGTITTTLQSLIPSTTYYIYIKSVCDSSTSSAWTDAKKITTLCDYYEILTTTPGTVCGSGQVPLEVTYTGGDVRWYTVPTGGSVIATGNSFTTPEINTTTSYWVSSAVTGGINNTGISTPSSSATALTITNWGIIFNAIEDTALNSVSVYSTTAGTLNIKIQNSAGVEIYETGNVNILAGGTTSPNIIPLNFTVPAGTGYKMLVKNASGVSLIRESSNLTFPYTGADGNMVVTSSEWGGSTTSYYYYFYDLKYTGICASPRTEVIATVTAAPNITLSATDIAICKGTPSAVVTITSGASDYNEYIWEPSTGLTGSAATGWIFNPAETTNYRLIAKQNQGSFCRTVKNVKVQVNPLVTFTPLQSDYVVCKDDVLELAYQELSKTDITVGTSTTLSTDYDATTAFMNRYDYSKQQYIYTKQELNALGFYQGKIKGLSFNITTLGSDATNQDYTIKIKSVTNNVISSTSFETGGFTTVYGPVTHTHTSSGWQDIMFTTTYEWDGSSNLLIEIYQKGIDSYNNARTYYSTLTTDVGLYQQSESDTSTGTLTKKRLNTKFFIDTGKVSWSPPTRLYTDSSGTLPYVSGSHAPKVYFKRNGDEEQDFNYTATFTSTVGCNTTQNIAVKVVDVKPPVVQDQLFCDAIPVDDIVVTAEPNATIRWYASATGTDILTSIDTTGTYYVDAERSGCKSERISAVITIVGAQTPTAPATQHFCDSALVSDLTVTIHQGFEARWYDAVASTTPLTGTVSLVNGATYYAATYHPGSGCESPRIPVTAVITPTPAALPAQSIHLCQATSFSGLQITTLPNAQLKWYVSATAVNPIASTQNVTSGVYYVSQTMNGCESARSQIQIMMQTALDKPAATTQNICGIGTVADLVATGAVPGAVYNWYDSATSTTPLPLTTSLTSGVYYVSQSLTGCESPRRSVSVRVLSKQAPVVNAFSFCGNARVGDLSLPTTTNISYRWYTTATSITELSQNVALTTGTYYVARVEHGCISERAAVPVTILPLPAPPTGSANQSFTVNEINEVTIADLEMDQTNIQWYISIQDAKTGNNPLSAVMPLISGQTYYAVIIGSNGCPSLPTAVTVDITLGIDAFDKTALVYYPNPVKDILNIRYKNVIEMVEVYNLLGQKVLIHEYKDMSIQLNMDSLASGSYLLKLRSENQVQIIKVVKK